MAKNTQEKNPVQKDYEDRFNPGEPSANLEQREAMADGSHDDVGLSPYEQAQIDQMEASLRENDFYEPDENGGSKTFYKSLKKKLNPKKHWKKYAIGSGLVGIFGGLGVFLFMFLPSLKVTHFLTNIEQRFFGVATNAIEARAEHLLSRYMRSYVFPSVRQCGRVVSIDCNPNFDPGRGIASNLFRNWSNARIEERLFVNHGIQIEHRTGDNYSIITRAGSVDVTGSNFDLKDLDRQDNVSGRQVRRELNRVLDQETFWKRLMMRRSVRKLAKSKYNIRWCLIACNTRDNIRETRISALQRLKLKTTERLMSPFSDRLGLYFTCAVNDCGNQEFISQRSSLVNRAIEELGEEEAERIISEVGDRRLSQVVVEKVMTRIFGTTAGRVGAAAVPVVGWIYAIDAIDQIDTKLYNGVISQYLADSTASQYAEFYLTFRAHYNEGTEGQLSADEIGAQSQLFDGVEGSLVYQQELGTGATNPVARLFSTPVNAQEEYLCADDEPIPEGELVCEERKVGKLSSYDSWRQSGWANSIMNSVVGAYRCGPHSVPISIANPNYCHPDSLGDFPAWPFDEGIHFFFAQFDNLLSSLVSAIGSIIPDDITEYFANLLGPVVQAVLEFVFTIINAGNGPGRQNFDDLYAGGDVVGNEFAKGVEDVNTGELLGLGGQLLSDEEVEQNLALLEEKQRESFESKNFFARLFSTDEQHSVVSQIALGLPSIGSIGDGFKTFMAMINPINTSSTIAASLTSNPSYAQATQFSGDPFGIDQYGYVVNDDSLTMDPEDLNEETCSPGGAIYEAWKAGIIGDEDGETTSNGQIEYTVNNPCMLEYTTTNILSCWFTDEDDCGAGQATSTSGPGVGQVVVGDTSNLECEAGTDAGVGDGYAQGKLYKIRLCSVQGIVVNSQISGELNSLLNDAAAVGIDFAGWGYRTMESQIELRRKHCGTSNYDIYQKPSSQCSPPTARPGYSNHQMGLAIDFTCNGYGTINKSARPGTVVCFNWLAANAENYGLYNLPSENWHWSVNGK